MQKLFVDFVIEENEKVVLNEEQSRHIAKSLRMRKGDMITLSNGDGNDWGCIIDEITQNNVILTVCYHQANGTEPSVKITLYQGLPKGDKMGDIIQKCTELGVSVIAPVLTNRCVSRPDAKSAEKKQKRFQKIALEAAQQSGRGIVPEITELQNIKKAVENDDSEVKILFYEGGGESLKSIVKSDVKSVSVYIGPEGGFEKDEVEMIKSAGGKVATLGKRILRTQTAPVAATAAILLLTNNLE
ncbi:MAG: 16S rRNA (uracil(1498)-N(3))-methyltransferase [Clostridiales bacterium]|nr:16S rRNA (uracil(1498)-N(3))-methyltransferase [Clostridiales bacterium]